MGDHHELTKEYKEYYEYSKTKNKENFDNLKYNKKWLINC